MYQTGTDYVPETGLAMLHKGEAVIPARENTGRNVVVNINNPYIASDMDIDAIGDKIVARMRRQGLKA